MLPYWLELLVALVVIASSGKLRLTLQPHMR
jgi:hypothetical protein